VAEGEDFSRGRVGRTRPFRFFDRPEERQQRALDLAVGRGPQIFLGRMRLTDSFVSPQQVEPRGLERSQRIEGRGLVGVAAPMPSTTRRSTVQTVRQVSRNFGKMARLISVGLRRRA